MQLNMHVLHALHNVKLDHVSRSCKYNIACIQLFEILCFLTYCVGTRQYSVYTGCPVCSALVIHLKHGQIFAIVMACSSSFRCYLCPRYAQYTPYSTQKL